MRPRAADRLELRGAAIAAALRLLAEHGAHALTLRAVAAAAGCSAPALYRYFASKDALLLAVHDEGFRRLYGEKLAAAARSEGDAFARLRLGGLAYVRFSIENPELYGIMFNDSTLGRHLGDLGSAGQVAEDRARAALGFLRQSILAVQAEGYLPGLDPDAAAFTFWSSVHGAASLALRGRAPFEGKPAVQAAEQAVETMMALVTASRR